MSADKPNGESEPQKQSEPKGPLERYNDARSHELRVAIKHATQHGRYEVASAVMRILLAKKAKESLPGGPHLTPEEQKIWDLVDGFSQRMGATVEELVKK